VQYNAFHDQLVMSGDTGAQGLLWRASSVSSAPLVDVDAAGCACCCCCCAGVRHNIVAPHHRGARPGDGLVQKLDKQEDSICAAAWSARDAWVFATLSVTGHVIAYSVSDAEKHMMLV
jgi:hypothetical protein